MATIKVLVLVLVCWAAVPRPAQQTTLRVPLSTEVTNEVTFDPSRVSAADVKRWILLSKHGPSNNDYIAMDMYVAEPQYQKVQQGQVNLHNAELNLS
jgi:hypothetical protein